MASLSFEYVDYLKHCLCGYNIIGFVSLEVVTIINTILLGRLVCQLLGFQLLLSHLKHANVEETIPLCHYVSLYY